jgi:Fur family transcriptional regulator, ferric uptake regulator
MGRATPRPHLDRCSLLQRLTAEGVRMTAQRRTLIEIIQESPDHLDAASLLRLAKARDTHIHRATVYRTLDLLKRMQIVDELDLMHLDGEKHFYEARVKSEHFHLACFTCGKIVEHNTSTFDQLKSEVSEQTGFKIEVVRLEIGGRCQNCKSENVENPDGKPSSSGFEPGVTEDR